MTSLALVGIGYWGRNLLRVFSELTDVPVCVHAGDPENGAWVRDNYPDVEVTTDYDAVLADPGVEAVAIATPIDTHYDLARRALDAGKHVFVEKPLAASPTDAEALTELAARRDVTLFVGYVLVHHPTMRPLISRARDRPVEWARFEWHKLGAFGENIRLDLLTHPVSVACTLFEAEPSEVCPLRSIDVTDGTDLLSVAFRYPDGATFDVDLDRVSPEPGKWMSVGFADGAVYCWTEAALYRFSRRDRAYEVERERDEEPLRAECRQFLSAVECGAPVRTDGAFGCRVNRIVDRLP